MLDLEVVPLAGHEGRVHPRRPKAAERARGTQPRLLAGIIGEDDVHPLARAVFGHSEAHGTGRAGRQAILKPKEVVLDLAPQHQALVGAPAARE